MSEPWTEREPSSFVPNPRLPLFPMFGEARCSPNPVQHLIYFFPGWESPRLPCCTASFRTAAVFDTLSLPSWLGQLNSPLLRHCSEPQMCSTLFCTYACHNLVVFAAAASSFLLGTIPRPGSSKATVSPRSRPMSVGVE